MKNITYDAGIFTRVTDDNQTSREAAKGYGDEGISCIPLDPSVKGQRIRWKDRDFGPEHFADTDNIAVKNGRPSGGRVAVDADTEISRKVWRELYGDTVTGGRTEDSH